MKKNKGFFTYWIIAIILAIFLSSCATYGCPNNVSKWERKNTFNK